MTNKAPLSILFLGPQSPLTAHIDSWLATHLPSPLTIRMTHALSDALEYLQAHRIDLVFLDLKIQEPSSQDALYAIHTASPTSALLALVSHTDDTTALDALRRGAHEVLAITSSSHTDACRTIARALARTGRQLPALIRPSTAPATPSDPARLIHDLNNLLTSINGFADLLLTRLAPQDPARPSAEHILTAGKRATALLKAHAPVPNTAPMTTPSPVTLPSSTTAKAA